MSVFLGKIHTYFQKLFQDTALFDRRSRIFSTKESLPFASVALVRAFENDTLMTVFVVYRHPDGKYTVFVPCGPNPTTGYIFHMQQQYVHPVKVPVEAALRSVISCGVGSKLLLDAFHQIPEGKQA